MSAQGLPESGGEGREALRIQFLAWLDDHWSEDRRACPICGSDDWQVWNMVAPPVIEPQGRHFTLGELLPCFPVACMVCGHIHLFSSFIAGVMPPVEEDGTQ